MNAAALAGFAAGLARQGIPVFPCRADKAPATSHGFKDATCDLRKIVELFHVKHAALIGVPTGLASNLTVLDIDPKGFPWLGNRLHALGKTRIHKTRRGYHLVYLTPDPPIANSASLLGLGVDVRGEGGYVIWWPAEIPMSDPSAPAPLPAWITALLKRKKTLIEKKHHQWIENVGEKQVSLEPLLRFVSTSTLGERNNRLFWASCRVAEKVAVGAISEADAVYALQSAVAGFRDQSKAIKTIKNGINRGMRDGARRR